MRRYLRPGIFLAVLAVAGYLTRGLALLALTVPPAWDIYYHFNRDRRYRYTPFPLTRRCVRLFILPARRTSGSVAELPVGARISRHIPQDVKVAVAARDGGHCRCPGCPRCSRGGCARTEQLQFGHVIPWSRGGAATAANILLQCKPCNLWWSDRKVVIPGHER